VLRAGPRDVQCGQALLGGGGEAEGQLVVGGGGGQELRGEARGHRPEPERWDLGAAAMEREVHGDDVSSHGPDPLPGPQEGLRLCGLHGGAGDVHQRQQRGRDLHLPTSLLQRGDPPVVLGGDRGNPAVPQRQ